MDFQAEAIRLTRARLRADKGLIGFVGGPWTLYVYAAAGSHEKAQEALGGLANGVYEAFNAKLLDLLAHNMALQSRAGAENIALFDTAAGEIDAAAYGRHVVPVLADLLARFRALDPHTPSPITRAAPGPAHWDQLQGPALPVPGRRLAARSHRGARRLRRPLVHPGQRGSGMAASAACGTGAAAHRLVRPHQGIARRQCAAAGSAASATACCSVRRRRTCAASSRCSGRSSGESPAASAAARHGGPGPRYTSYPTVTHWGAPPPAAQWLDWLAAGVGARGSRGGLYVHIPFCQSLCSFCGCNMRLARNHALAAPYVDTLLKEFALYRAGAGRRRCRWANCIWAAARRATCRPQRWTDCSTACCRTRASATRRTSRWKPTRATPRANNSPCCAGTDSTA